MAASLRALINRWYIGCVEWTRVYIVGRVGGVKGCLYIYDHRELNIEYIGLW